MSFSFKRLAVKFIRAQGVFAGTNANTVTYQDLRVSAVISDAVGPYPGRLDLLLWGIKEADMADLFYLEGAPFTIPPRNRIALYAAAGSAAFSIVWQGQITQAQPDYTQMPDVPFHVSAFIAGDIMLMPTPAMSFPGRVPVETILASICANAGLTLQNEGVSGPVLTDMAVRGAAVQQIEKVTQAAGIEWIIELPNLIIWPKTGARQVSVPEIGPMTGLIGYPERTQFGVNFRCEYNPLIRAGGLVQIKTSAATPHTEGKWRVQAYQHHLDAEVPGGAWFSDITTINPNTV